MASKVRAVVPGVWEIPLGFVNAFLVDSEAGLVLIDTGVPGSAKRILEAIGQIGRQPADLRHILVTHCHADHAGGLAELKRHTDATAVMHPDDAAMVRAGRCLRPLHPSPGLLGAIFSRLARRLAPSAIEPAEVEHELRDGETFAGLRAIHVPGHCLGQLAFLWPHHGGVLFAADAADHVLGLSLSPLYEDLPEGLRSLSKLARLDFSVACFGHGRPIPRDASSQFRAKWGAVREPQAV
jgi:glyoxylase-like metal-dependent hydrolase (beta-lactamase superfamily II)